MPELPTGTITFLFTDIEGSTTLWEHHPEEARVTLARHDELVEQVVARHNGVVVRPRGEGDSRFAVFSQAQNAVTAAVALQQALHSEPWPALSSKFKVPGSKPDDLEPGTLNFELKVRMALHTGEADLRAGDYYGSDVNRCARLRSVAHGGQTIISQATYSLVRDQPPQGVELRDLGEHRLKDLVRPEHIFQLAGPGLPTTFPPLKSLDIRPNNLPVQRTPLVGREKELEAAQRRLMQSDVALLTFTGPGGTGKTRLAVQVAANLIDYFQDGVYFVNLASTTDVDMVIIEIAEALDVREAANPDWPKSKNPLLESVKEHLRDKQMLLLLDNFEQVVEAAPILAELLSCAARLKILVTSRTLLNLRDEHDFPVPPLTLPNLKRLPSLNDLIGCDAVRLFVDRAVSIKPDFQLTNENAPSIAQICARLDGLPLAIELAAARVNILPPAAMLKRLSSRLKLLTGGARDLPTRQQTLRGAIEWSYSLLDEPEQQLFRRLAVFAGGRTLEAIEEICAFGGLQIDVLDGVESLVNKSLLKREEDMAGGETRLVMLETIHEFSRERLAESGEADEVSRRHACFFVDVVEKMEPALQGDEQGDALRRLEDEYANILVALRWAIEHEPTLGLRLAGSLSLFWEIRGYLSEARHLLADLLSRPETREHSSERAKTLNVAGNLADVQNDYEAARTYYSESLAIYRELGDKSGAARPLNGLGLVAWNEGDLASAQSFLEESLAIKRGLGDENAISISLNNLGLLSHTQGDYANARAYLEESLAIDRKLNDQDAIATSLGNLGAVELDTGNYQEAQRLVLESVELFHRVGDKHGVADSLENLVGVTARLGRPMEAAVLGGAAEALRDEIATPLSPAESARYETHLAVARAQLDGDAWQSAWAEGRGMGLEQVVAYALESVGSRL
ncbi:MAG TPA: tetratricopeptide repeat protein [Chloroflexia bacterium]|nr:tetratricopeptide repeat protein [Chloroflexia bacterium]